MRIHETKKITPKLVKQCGFALAFLLPLFWGALVHLAHKDHSVGYIYLENSDPCRVQGERRYYSELESQMLEFQIEEEEEEEEVSELPDLGMSEDVEDRAREKTNKFKDEMVSESILAAESISKDGFKNYSKDLKLRLLKRANGVMDESLTKNFHSYGTLDIKSDFVSKPEDPSVSLNALVPLTNNESKVVFAQFGLQLNNEENYEGRDFLNFGLGWRHVNENYLFGVNTFYDYDLKRGHERASLGLEGWLDYVKFSGNYYFPISNWKLSPTNSEFDERPARGMDISAQAFLPNYPNLGASVTFAAYRGLSSLEGSEIGTDDPYSLDVGIIYTPFPLVNLDFGFRKKSDSAPSFVSNIEFSYKFGKSFSEQVSPENVKNSRLVKNQILDVVKRNNNIVLERKKRENNVETEPVRTIEFDALNGGRGKVSLSINDGQLTVVDNYGLLTRKAKSFDNVIWQVSDLFLPFGSLTFGTGYTIDLNIPPFAGDYHLSANVKNEGYSLKSNVKVNDLSKRYFLSTLNATVNRDKTRIEFDPILINKSTLRPNFSLTNALFEYVYQRKEEGASIVLDYNSQSLKGSFDFETKKISIESQDRLTSIASILASNDSPLLASFTYHELVLDINVDLANGRSVSSYYVEGDLSGSVKEGQIFTSSPASVIGKEGNMSFALGGDDASHMSVGSNGSVIMIEKDFETPVDKNADNEYTATLFATDSLGRTASKDFVIKVTNAIEKSDFLISIPNGKVQENLEFNSQKPVFSGMPIGKVSYLLSGPDAKSASIDILTGVIKLPAQDYEIPGDTNKDNQYEFIVLATDGDGNMAETQVNVVVTDTEDGQFVLSIDDMSVVENQKFVSPVPKVIGAAGKVKYRLEGPDMSLGSIDVLSGVVTLPAQSYKKPLDANKDNVFEFVIVGVDESGSQGRVTMRVTIVEDKAPTLVLKTNNAVVFEHRVFVSDAPMLSGSNLGTVQYYLEGPDADKAKIVIDTGVVTLPPQNFEYPKDENKDNVFEFVIVAKEKELKIASTDMTVTIKDIDESYSHFDLVVKGGQVLENKPFISEAPIVIRPNGKVVFTLKGEDSNTASIDQNTGIVTLPAQDYEKPRDANKDNIYKFTVIVTDDSGAQIARKMSIVVKDDAESSITYKEKTNTTVVENRNFVSSQPIVNGLNGSINYYLEEPDSTFATIDVNSGVVTLFTRDYENPLDSNKDNVYELGVVAKSASGKVAKTKLKIKVLDEIDFSFNPNLKINDSVTVTENHEIEIPIIGDLKKFRVRNNIGMRITGPDASHFKIKFSPPRVGTMGLLDVSGLTFAAQDFENPQDLNKDNSYEAILTFGVSASGYGPDRAVSFPLKVTVLDENESLDIELLTDYTVEEGASLWIIPKINGISSVASSSNYFRYSLSGEDFIHATVSSMGEIYFHDQNWERPNDGDYDNIYNFKLVVEDLKTNAKTVKSFRITVTDVVEPLVLIPRNGGRATISENIEMYLQYDLTPHIVVGNSMKYWFTGDDAKFFGVTGEQVLYLSGQDYENPRDLDKDNIYEATLHVANAAGDTVSGKFAIKIIDDTTDNNNHPSLSVVLRRNHYMLLENRAYSTQEPSIIRSKGKVTYSLARPIPGVRVDTVTGVLNISGLDYETRRHIDIEIFASDIDGTVQSLITTIDVFDVAEESKIGSEPQNIPDKFSVQEGARFDFGRYPYPDGLELVGINGPDADFVDFGFTNNMIKKFVFLEQDFENPHDENNDNIYELILTFFNPKLNSFADKKVTVEVLDLPNK